jgi:hypothetical protein
MLGAKVEILNNIDENFSQPLKFGLLKASKAEITFLSAKTAFVAIPDNEDKASDIRIVCPGLNLENNYSKVATLFFVFSVLSPRFFISLINFCIVLLSALPSNAFPAFLLLIVTFYKIVIKS